MKVLVTERLLATRSNASRSCLGAWNLLDPGLPLSQQCPSILANEIVAKNFFVFTYFHGILVARPHGRRLLTRNGKVQEVIFSHDITGSAYIATIGLAGSFDISAPGQITVVGRAGNANGVFVQTSDSTGTPTSLGFHLAVHS
jgi:hypothetical protein